MRIIKYVLLFGIVLIGVTFAILNPAAVTVNYYLGEKSLPLSLLLVSTFSIGVLFGLIVSFWLVLKVKIKNYHLKQRLKMADKEVQNLRAIPLQDNH